MGYISYSSTKVTQTIIPTLQCKKLTETTTCVLIILLWLVQVYQAENNYLEHIIAQNSANDKREDITLTLS